MIFRNVQSVPEAARTDPSWSAAASSDSSLAVAGLTATGASALSGEGEQFEGTLPGRSFVLLAQQFDSRWRMRSWRRPSVAPTGPSGGPSASTLPAARSPSGTRPSGCGRWRCSRSRSSGGWRSGSREGRRAMGDRVPSPIRPAGDEVVPGPPPAEVRVGRRLVAVLAVVALIVVSGWALTQVGIRPSEAAVAGPPTGAWFCPHGGGKGWQAWIVVANPGPEPASRADHVVRRLGRSSARVDVHGGSGRTTSSIPSPRSRWTPPPRSSSSAAGWRRRRSSSRRPAASPPSGASTRRSRRGSFPTPRRDRRSAFLVVMNPFDVSAEFDVVFRTENRTIHPGPLTPGVLRPGRSTAIRVNSFALAGPNERTVTAEVRPIMGRVVAGGVGIQGDALRAEAGQSRAAPRLFIPATGSGAGRVYVANVGSSDVVPAVLQLGPGGSRSVSGIAAGPIPPGRAATFEQSGFDDASDVVAAKGRALLAAALRLDGGGTDQATIGAVTEPAARWVVPAAVPATGGTQELALLNPGRTSVQVTVQLFGEAGPAAGETTVTVPAGRTVTVEMTGTFTPNPCRPASSPREEGSWWAPCRPRRTATGSVRRRACRGAKRMEPAEPHWGTDPYHRAGTPAVVERTERVEKTGHGKGRHRRGPRWGWLSIAGIVTGVVVVLLAGAAFAGYSYDRAKAATILPGVRVENVNVGGMTRAEAARALAPAIQTFLQQPIDITAGDKHWTMTREELGVKVDADGAVDRALHVSDSLAWPSRVYHRLFGRPVAASVTLPYSVDPTVVDAVRAADVQGGPPHLAGRQDRLRRRRTGPAARPRRQEAERTAGRRGAARVAAQGHQRGDGLRQEDEAEDHRQEHRTGHRDPAVAGEALPVRQDEAEEDVLGGDGTADLSDAHGALRDHHEGSQPHLDQPGARYVGQGRAAEDRPGSRQSPGDAGDGALRPGHPDPRHARGLVDRNRRVARLHPHAHVGRRATLHDGVRRDAGHHRHVGDGRGRKRRSASTRSGAARAPPAVRDDHRGAAGRTPRRCAGGVRDQDGGSPAAVEHPDHDPEADGIDGHDAPQSRVSPMPDEAMGSSRARSGSAASAPSWPINRNPPGSPVGKTSRKGPHRISSPSIGSPRSAVQTRNG